MKTGFWQRKGIVIILLAAVLVIAAGIYHFTHNNEGGYEYSNLNNENVRDYVSKRLLDAGIPESNVKLLMYDVAEYNASVDGIGLTEEDWVKSDDLPYDASRDDCIDADEKRIEKWQAANPDFDGYNCRITAYTLFKGLVNTDNTEGDDSFLVMDLASIENAPVSHFTQDELTSFKVLNRPIITESTTDQAEVARLAQEQWQKNGVSFAECDAKLITVRIHMGLDDTSSELDIGHVGVLVPDGDGYLFIEKLSFQSPYQVLKFSIKQDLKDYLLQMYSSYTDPSSAEPFIMENYEII